MDGRYRYDAPRNGASELSTLYSAQRIAPHLRGSEMSCSEMSCVDGSCIARENAVIARLVSTVLCPAFGRGFRACRWP
jgi:hypothetical protein